MKQRPGRFDYAVGFSCVWNLRVIKSQEKGGLKEQSQKRPQYSADVF